MSLILGLLEPDIEYVESHYERHISLPYHICSQTTSLSYVNTERKAVISPENRQRAGSGGSLFTDRPGIRRRTAPELRLYRPVLWAGALCGEFQHRKHESDRRILSRPRLRRRQLQRHISGHRRFCCCGCGDYHADPETGAALIPDRRVLHERL